MAKKAAAESLEHLEAHHIIDPETGEMIFSPSLLELEEHAVKMFNYLNPDGSENPDPTPLAPPVGYVKRPSLVDNIRAMIREHAVSIALAGQEAETFEEADDFDVQDDYDPASPWEGEFEPVVEINKDILDPNSPRAPKKPVAERPPAPAEQPPQGGTGGDTPPPPKPKD
jgi:hypothetical protein